MMMKRWTVGVVAAALLGTISFADKMETPRGGGRDPGQVLLTLERASAPKDEHRVLAEFAGDYKYVGELAIGPGVAAKLRGQCKVASIMGGRYVEFTSTASTGEPPTIESKAVLGYDTRKGKYTYWGIDTLGTSFVSAEGEYDAATRTFTLYGAEMEGDRPARFRFTFRLEEVGYRVMVEFEAEPDQWAKAMEMAYTRAG
jgi:hypothetical protein